MWNDVDYALQKYLWTNIRDLLPQNEREVASLYTEIYPVKHVTEQ